MMELEALQEVDPEVRALGARIVALTPELERYTRSVHKKLNLTFDILTDLHLKTAEHCSPEQGRHISTPVDKCRVIVVTTLSKPNLKHMRCS